MVLMVLFQLQDLAFRIDGDLLRQVAFCNRRCHFRDVTNLSSQVTGELVHVVGEIFPRSRYAFHLSLAAEFSFRSHFFCDPSHFRGEGVQLIHHDVDRVV